MIKPLILIILDGWGIKKQIDNNAIALADTPNMDDYQRIYPFTTLGASGLDVGLPEGQMGNSEVGHINIGAGRIVPQEFLIIDKSIENKSFFENRVLVKAIERVKDKPKKLHLMGLIGPGGVHSHSRHLYALLEMAKSNGLKKNQVIIHCFLDGRDTPQKSAKPYIKKLEEKIKELDSGKIATVIGRYYAMDRDNRWDRTEKAYRAMVYGKGRKAKTAEKAVEIAYQKGETDEFVFPTVIKNEEDTDFTVDDGDSIIVFNFRPDRVRQITRAFTEKNFNKFKRKKLKNIYFVCMTQYDKKFRLPVAFKPIIPKNTLGEVLSKNNLKQLRIAETEKYAHVTYFFNGGREKPFKNEDRLLIPSPKIATYDLKPEMSAFNVTDEVIKQIKSDKYDVIILNYANPDMVGHTGKLEAAIKACETVDKCTGKVVDTILSKEGIALITGDHGNAEEMLDQNGKPHTFHTINPVPFIITDENINIKNKGRLADIAPTILKILGISRPSEMSGNVLF